MTCIVGQGSVHTRTSLYFQTIRDSHPVLTQLWPDSAHLAGSSEEPWFLLFSKQPGGSVREQRQGMGLILLEGQKGARGCPAS